MEDLKLRMLRHEMRSNTGLMFIIVGVAVQANGNESLLLIVLGGCIAIPSAYAAWQADKKLKKLEAQNTE